PFVLSDQGDEAAQELFGGHGRLAFLNTSGANHGPTKGGHDRAEAALAQPLRHRDTRLRRSRAQLRELLLGHPDLDDAVALALRCMVARLGPVAMRSHETSSTRLPRS